MNVYGYSEDGRYALVLGEDHNVRVYSVHDGRLTGGRWECSETHLGYYEDVYRKRFPVLPG